MKVTIKPSNKMSGQVKVPGDKSISHRLAMLGAIAERKTIINRFSTSTDCTSTLNCLRQLGVQIEIMAPDQVIINGRGLWGLRPSTETLDAGNSGSTIRMLSGILAGQDFLTKISGDASLRNRPMKRIIDPLSQMGARIEATQESTPPLSIRGGGLRSLDYSMPVASAQVKSAILLAGLYANGNTWIREPGRTRNHTELALQQFGVEVNLSQKGIGIRGGQKLLGIETIVPGDISSAAFLIVATLLIPNSETIIENVGLNPGRRGIIDVLIQMGGSIEILRETLLGGEAVGDLRIRSSPLQGGSLTGSLIPQIIDEIPILAVLATKTKDGLTIRDATELRVKESNRIKSIVENLRAMGATVEEYEDGMSIPGQQSLQGTRVTSQGDHRIAMAFAIAGLVAKGTTTIEDGHCAAISFPGFYRLLERLTSS